MTIPELPLYADHLRHLFVIVQDLIVAPPPPHAQVAAEMGGVQVGGGDFTSGCSKCTTFLPLFSKLFSMIINHVYNQGGEEAIKIHWVMQRV